MTRRSSFDTTAFRGKGSIPAAAALAAALLLGAVAAPAQTDGNGGEPRFYGGAHVFFSNSTVSASRTYDPRMGIGGGGYVGATVWKSIDLQVGADYVQKGALLSVGRWTIEWQLDYLEVPILAVYNFHPRSRTSFEVVAGVGYGFAMHQQLEEGHNLGYDLKDFKGKKIPLELDMIDVGGTPTPRTSVLINDVKTTELTAMLGFGLSAPVGSVNVCFDVRYEVGLTDPVVSTTFQQVVGEGKDATIESFPEDISNNVFCFFMGFEFPFGSRASSE